MMSMLSLRARRSCRETEKNTRLSCNIRNGWQGNFGHVMNAETGGLAYRLCSQSLGGRKNVFESLFGTAQCPEEFR